MREKTNAYTVLVPKPGDKSQPGRVILKWILKK
jgi:hypothetical protein